MVEQLSALMKALEVTKEAKNKMAALNKSYFKNGDIMVKTDQGEMKLTDLLSKMAEIDNRINKIEGKAEPKERFIWNPANNQEVQFIERDDRMVTRIDVTRAQMMTMKNGVEPTSYHVEEMYKKGYIMIQKNVTEMEYAGGYTHTFIWQKPAPKKMVVPIDKTPGIKEAVFIGPQTQEPAKEHRTGCFCQECIGKMLK